MQKKQLFFFLKSVTEFVLFSVVFYFLMICLLGEFLPNITKNNLRTFRYSNSDNTSRILKEVKEIRGVKNIDILFLGSSHTFRGFDNRIFKKENYESFNLGTMSQTPMQTEILLKRYLNKFNPKTIIFEVNPITFSSDGIESTLDIIQNDKADFNMVFMNLKQNNIMVYNTFIYTYYRNLIKKKLPQKKSLSSAKDYYIPGGYVQREIYYYKPIAYSEENWNFKENQFLAFERVLKIINQKTPKIKLILIQAPITQSFYNSHTNNEVFDKRISSLGLYYNFNKLIRLNDSLDFYDKHHLNQNGVEKFNKAVINILKKDN